MRVIAMYLAYKWAMSRLNIFLKQVKYPYEKDVREIFEDEYAWMYNILNPRIQNDL